MQIKIINILVLSLILSSCASQGVVKVPDGLKIASARQVENCELKGDINGVSMLYGVLANEAIANAKKQAFEQAKELGANTIVWDPIKTQYGGTSVHGNAYTCN